MDGNRAYENTEMEADTKSVTLRRQSTVLTVKILDSVGMAITMITVKTETSILSPSQPPPSPQPLISVIMIS